MREEPSWLEFFLFLIIAILCAVAQGAWAQTTSGSPASQSSQQVVGKYIARIAS